MIAKTTFRFAVFLLPALGLMSLVRCARAAEPEWSVKLSDQFITIPDSDGDVWSPAWMKDGTVFSSADDSVGFHKAGSSNVLMNRLTGDDINNLKGETVNLMSDYGKVGFTGDDGCCWKSAGCAAIDGAIYLVVTRHIYGHKTGDPNHRQIGQNGSIIKSTDGGKTWTRSMQENYEHPMFPGRRFATPFFIEYGQDGAASVDNADKYVYATANNGFWDNGDSMILGRVLRSKLGDLKGSDWEYYHGGDGMKEAAWQADMFHAKLLWNSLGKVSMTGAAYIPGIKQYLSIQWYYPGGSGLAPNKSSSHTVWEFYLSPRPWGPWTKVGSHEFQPQGYYDPAVFPKFTSADGKHLYAITSGDFLDKTAKYQSVTFVPFELVPAGAH